MPELPEVETMRRQLENEMRGVRIADVVVRFGKRLKPSPAKFRAAISGMTVKNVRRRAKLLLIGLSNGQTVAAHLKMTGSFLIKPNGAAPTKHTHVIFELADGRRLFFEDVRKFGFLKVLPTAEVEREIIAGDLYGPEPLLPDFTPERFAACLLRRPGRTLKPLLLDQTCIAGVGNIYADESLWRAKIRPGRRVKSLKADELRRLHRGVVDSLQASVERRGTSADSFVDLYGKKGENQFKLKAYGREGEPCPRCGGPIKRIRLGGRGTHYCPVCQK